MPPLGPSASCLLGWARAGRWSRWPERRARPAAGGSLESDDRGVGSGLVGCCLGEQLQEAGPAAAPGDPVTKGLAVDSRSRYRCSRVTVVWSGPSAVKWTSISLAWVGSGSYCQWPLICQVTTSRWGGSQASTRPQSHSLPSVPCSYQRPPWRGSRMAVAMSAWPMWYSAGHQLPKVSVKVRNTCSAGASIVSVPVSGGMVGMLVIGPPVRGRWGPPGRPCRRR